MDTIDQGTVIGHAHPAKVVEPGEADDQRQGENLPPAYVHLLMSEKKDVN